MKSQRMVLRQDGISPNLVKNNEYSPWDSDLISINLGAKHDIYLTFAVYCRKRISMLACLKLSSLAFKSLFYRPEHLEIMKHDNR